MVQQEIEGMLNKIKSAKKKTEMEETMKKRLANKKINRKPQG